MPEDHVKTGVAPGDFPFPLTEGPEESRYLTWVRNHSNYMAVRGLLDYLRAVGVLVRGALVNFLIGLPYLLLLAILVATVNLIPDTPGFFVTWIVLYVAGVWILAFPLLTLLGQHIGEQVLSHVPPTPEGTVPDRLGYDDLARWFERLREVGQQETDQTL